MYIWGIRLNPEPELLLVVRFWASKAKKGNWAKQDSLEEDEIEAIEEIA